MSGSSQLSRKAAVDERVQSKGCSAMQAPRCRASGAREGVLGATKEVLVSIDFLAFNLEFLGFSHSFSIDFLGFLLGFYQDSDSILLRFDFESILA